MTEAKLKIGTTIHMCVDIAGTLNSNFSIRCFFGDLKEGRAYLKQALSEGKKILPIGEPCEGFSYQTGCPGHKTEVEQKT